MCPIGTHGDVLPFIRLGDHLKRCGHRVTLATNGPFRKLSLMRDLEFDCIYEEGLFEAGMNTPHLWHPVRSFTVLMRDLAFKAIEPLYHRVSQERFNSDTVVVSGPLSLGARLACEQWGIPHIILCLQPAVIRSIHATPRISGMPWISGMPRRIRILMARIMDAYVDRLTVPELRRFRAAAGMDRSMGHFLEWWIASVPVLALFPSWYARRQTDWPENIEQLDFPLESESLARIPDDVVRKFLDQGSAPVVFTWGTGMRHSLKFHQEALAICRRTGVRGIIVTPGMVRETEENEGILQTGFIDFQGLLPKCRAIVHHGGIGTTAEAFRAGIPQLVVPMAFDQPDNAERIRRAGTGDILKPSQFRCPAAAGRLMRLIESRAVRERCGVLRERMAAHGGTVLAAKRIIEIGQAGHLPYSREASSPCL